MNEDYFGKYEWDDKSILVVEDNLSSVFYLKEVLKDTNAEIIVATNGQDAVRECILREDIDLVLMDIQLPVMNGYSATRKIKELRPDLPVIVQTAHAMTEDKKKCIKAGCDDYLTKPINPITLLDTISEFLNELKVPGY